MNNPFAIMLVDDDEDDQLIFTAVISEINHTIACKCVDNAISGLETLKKNSDYKPDCIFLDLNLPLMHGFEFLQSIKTSTELNNIPVVIYSTSSREADKVRAMELGAYNFLSKQTTYSQLKDKIADVLSSMNAR